MKRKKSNPALDKKLNHAYNIIMIPILILFTLAFVSPIIIILINSFKGKLFINKYPFSLPNKDSFVGIKNYTEGIKATQFLNVIKKPVGPLILSLFITIISVLVIVIFTSMTGWFITRVKGKLSSFLYMAFAFSMIVPFQMVMFTMVFVSNRLYLDNPIGIILIYLGFGAGLSVFMFCGFVKSIPVEIEEAAMIDGCTPLRMFFSIVLPMLKPTAITVAILNAMWIWNDYLLPYLVLDSDYKTIPIAIQYLQDGYGSIDRGYMMALLVIAILPIVIFYVTCQKYIIRGVAAGAVKG